MANKRIAIHLAEPHAKRGAKSPPGRGGSQSSFCSSDPPLDCLHRGRLVFAPEALRGAPKGRGGSNHDLRKTCLRRPTFLARPRKVGQKKGAPQAPGRLRPRHLTLSGINSPRQEGQILTTRSRSLRNQPAGRRNSLVASESHTAALMVSSDLLCEIERRQSPPWRGAPKGRGGSNHDLRKTCLRRPTFLARPRKVGQKKGSPQSPRGLWPRHLALSGINSPRQEGQILTTRSRSLRNQPLGGEMVWLHRSRTPRP